MYSIVSDAIDSVKSWFESVIENLIFRLFYLLESLILRFLALIEDTMMIFTGERTIKYDTKDTTLIDVFFSHDSVRGVYTAIAIIGIIFAFGFAVIAIIRKIGDFRDKQQGVTLGVIVGNLLKSILLIVGMNAIMIVAISTTTILTRSVSEAVKGANRYVPDESGIVFTDDMYAAMGRVINTIGNYSLNPSYRSRYNLNACYNDIRADLQKLGDAGVLKYHYVSYDADKKEEVTWQSLMEELGTAYDYTREAPLDSYDDGLTNAILNCIEILRANTTMRVLTDYATEIELTDKETESVPIDRIVFLIGTMGTIGNNAAARNNAYNKNPSFFDSVRQPFYTGEKSIYSWDEVKAAFDPSPVKMNYILVYAIAIAMLMELLVIIITCAVRIFNLLALYIASPLVIAAMPLDDGGKFKQWITAFIVQLLGVVGMVLSMRLLLLFLPIVWNPALEISSNVILDCIVKAVITYGAMTAVNKVNGIFTGILADNAGYQAILAGDVRDKVQNSAVGRALDSASASNIGGKVAGKIGNAVTGGAKNFAGKWAGKLAESTGLASVGRSIRGAAEAAGFVKPHDKSKDPEHVQHARERGRQRDMKSLQSDLNYAKQNGVHRNGSALKAGELQMMQHTLNHMQNGNHSLSQAKKLAEVDMKQDALDAERAGREKASELQTSQRLSNRNNGGGPGGGGPGGGGPGGGGPGGGGPGGGGPGGGGPGGGGHGGGGPRGGGLAGGPGAAGDLPNNQRNAIGGNDGNNNDNKEGDNDGGRNFFDGNPGDNNGLNDIGAGLEGLNDNPDLNGIPDNQRNDYVEGGDINNAQPVNGEQAGDVQNVDPQGINPGGAGLVNNDSQGMNPGSAGVVNNGPQGMNPGSAGVMNNGPQVNPITGAIPQSAQGIPTNQNIPHNKGTGSAAGNPRMTDNVGSVQGNNQGTANRVPVNNAAVGGQRRNSVNIPNNAGRNMGFVPNNQNSRVSNPNPVQNNAGGRQRSNSVNIPNRSVTGSNSGVNIPNNSNVNIPNKIVTGTNSSVNIPNTSSSMNIPNNNVNLNNVNPDQPIIQNNPVNNPIQGEPVIQNVNPLQGQPVVQNVSPLQGQPVVQSVNPAPEQPVIPSVNPAGTGRAGRNSINFNNQGILNTLQNNNMNKGDPTNQNRRK